jgi:FdhD protein
MEPIYEIEVVKIDGEKRVVKKDIVVREIKLDIVLNGKKIASLMATPIDQEALCMGYLRAENIIKDMDDVKSIKLVDDGMRVEIEAKSDIRSVEKLNSEGVVVSGCGKGVSANIDPDVIEAKVIKSDFAIKSEKLSNAMGQFYTECPLYEETGCVHTAKLYVDEKNHFIGEDIAQHNTIDKAVGKAMMGGVDLSNSFLMVSGRLSSEMVAKAVMHSIPILASRTASTCLGVKIAEKFGLTLAGFVRGKRMNIYTHPQRIV